MKKIGLILILFLAIWGCSEDKLDTFNGTDCIYFAPDASSNYNDTVRFSFAMFNADDTIIPLTVRAMGKMFDTPRSFKVVVEALTDAPGDYYDAILPEYTIQGGTRLAYIPVKIYRHPDLLQKNVVISFYLAPNDNFGQIMPVKINDGKEVDITRQVFVFTNQITMPRNWNYFGFGYWSAEKFMLMNKVLDSDPAQWYGSPNIGLAGAAANYMKNYLNEMIAKGPEYAIKDKADGATRGYMTVPGVVVPDIFPDAN